MYNLLILGLTTVLLIGANHITIANSSEAAFQSGLVSAESGTQYAISDNEDRRLRVEFVPCSRFKRQAPPPTLRNSSVETGKPVENNPTIQTVPTSAIPLPTTAAPATTPSAAASVVAVTSAISTVVPQNQNSTTINNTEHVLDDSLDRLYPNYVNPNLNQENSTLIQRNDTFKYYNAMFTPPPNGTSYWINLDNHPAASDHEMLSSAHRRAATIKLKFNFPFYGHYVDNVTVATGGFVYLGEQVHSWLAATQYVAPLMANFDSSLSENASVRILSTVDLIAVEWRGVHLKDSPSKGTFTFQTSLHKNGTIVFAYKSVPLNILSINDTLHPVKVGLSDAFVRDKNVLLFKQKTIYEYDRIELRQQSKEVINGSAVVFSPVPTCLSYKNCFDCSNHNSTFTCVWCHASNRCSDGTDRYRQDWLTKNCENTNVTKTEQCDNGSTSQYTIDSTTTHNNYAPSKSHFENHVNKEPFPQHQEGMGAAGVIGILFLVMLIVTGAGWVFYAYLFPHSTSGQLLIRYRPSQWTFRRGEARYTAASIHM